MADHSHHHSHGHDHDRSHGHGDHGHDHSHDDESRSATSQTLYEQIRFDDIRTLNETASGSGAAIVKKTWAQRLDVEPELESDCDEQLIMIIPFTGQTRLTHLLLRTSADASAPNTLKIFANRDDLDFSSASDTPATQTLSLAQSSEVQEIPLKRTLFNNVSTLTLFFEDNWSGGDEDVTRVSYLGFLGEWLRFGQRPVNVLYEKAPNPADHAPIVGINSGMEMGGFGR